ncbi:DNA sulfur modification protein DndE [Vibrio parahaemolyticus]|uniref:DNA sulfur modification protein DndE n=1 Tax=Vibrio parahaemolyticus TaxID=670 RepID=UPI001EFC600A|nr:DNA sulfur modification protein DndE [Vibrio parahaemolyticus]MCG9540498.1 DNA sulfur modification protein DndE [Vibrio parahaemolyticus]HCG7229865.1 DNA sulfur modification protein DndE [Vibrio parahaemolyticus]
MLPNRMNLTRSTEEQLKKLKGYTGITPNVSARIAFFRSIESDFRYQGQEAKLDGSLVLDKHTWLGETSDVTELILKMYYPRLDTKEYQQAWAAHVEDGIASIRNHRTLTGFATSV